MNGWQLGPRLRERQGGALRLLVAVTGHGREQDVGRSLRSGFDDHLTKPPDLDELKRHRDLGVARMNVRLPAAKANEILPVLDRWAKLIRQARQ